ncbi:L,D-transpeptidase family protein [Streptomyces sp. NPDC048106]|uniref:L,D-transpeptidase family protein n=1 Tax=Streptomyces sp. NPDC048106 TaxID=3155750 RepID=UPI003454933B
MSVASFGRVRSALVGAGALTVLAAGLTAAPATAAAPAPPAPGRHGSGAAHHKAPHVAPNTSLRFIRNASNPLDSRLQVLRVGKVLASYRAGSGMGLGRPDDRGRKDCAVGVGWLPKGTYTVGPRTTRYPGAKVHGYAIPLSDKKCPDNRTWRTQLLVHSKMTTSGASQWKGPDSYRSNGCVKLSPADIRKLFHVLDRYPRPTRLTVV